VTRIQTGKKNYSFSGGGSEKPKGDINQLAYWVDSTILNYRYAYDNKGLMTFRSESVINRSEEYNYDNLDRLTKITTHTGTGQPVVQQFSFANNGNINNNTAVGSYTYADSGPVGTRAHAVSDIVPVNNTVFSANDCFVDYNFFNQPTQIKEVASAGSATGGLSHRLNLSYGANQQRNKVVKYCNDTLINTRYYINKHYEKEIDSAGVTWHYHYIYGDNGVVALHITRWLSELEATDSMYYIHTDHLGSYCALTNASKKVVQRNYFDAWGNYTLKLKGSRDLNLPPGEPQTGIMPVLTFGITDRGFTGHEHYPQFKIINMNGRLYDPVIGRFFSPDKYVANSSFTQDFNRYTYARNNPLMYTDPDGEFIYINLGFGWSEQGGFSVSFGIGVGFKNGLSAGISIGYSFGDKSFSINGEVSYGGGYASAGWNSNAGWNVSTGYSYGAQVGPFSVSIFNTGISYSQNGGFSWNPSYGMSYTATSGHYGTYATYDDGKPVGDPVPYSLEYALEFMEKNNIKLDGITELFVDGTFPSNYELRRDGVYDKKTNKPVMGITQYTGKKLFFWGQETINVYLMESAFSTPEKLYLTIGHESIHVDLHNMGYHNHDKHEKTAYDWTWRQAAVWKMDYDGYYQTWLKNNAKPYPQVRDVKYIRPIR
jgi:RHS repeat-associated protein